MRWLNFFEFLKVTKPFSAWQVELTTRCPLSCKMCIRQAGGDWFFGDMKLEDFKKLTPYFRNVEAVILEGWGESLLYKNLIDAIRLTKAEGTQVGFVTSGVGLDRNYILELITSGVDFIGFSLSGVTPKTHDTIRINSNLQSLLMHIQLFSEIKAYRKTKHPKLHIIYLMLKDNIFEVPALLQLAKNIGIQEVVLTNLIHITNDWQERQRVFRCNEYLNPLYQEILNEVKIKSKELNINIRMPSLSAAYVPVCEENPLRNLYISVDGEVSPCVYLYPPLPSPFKRIFCGNYHEIKKVSSGNIFKEPFDIIWNKKDYIEFRERFNLRKRRFKEVYSTFIDVEKLKKLEPSSLPQPPKECLTCHKMLGF